MFFLEVFFVLLLVLSCQVVDPHYEQSALLLNYDHYLLKARN